MMANASKVPPVEDVGFSSNVAELYPSTDSIGNETGRLSVDANDSLLTLALEDLVVDDNGEVVLFNDSNLRALALETHNRVLESGAVDKHMTVSGDDVTGFQYMSFDNGTVLYFQDGLNLIIVDQ